jgi:hypothetical protein
VKNGGGDFFAKLARKNGSKKAGFWTENLERTFFLCTFALPKKR